MFALFRLAQQNAAVGARKREGDTMHRRWSPGGRKAGARMGNWRPGGQRERFATGQEMSPTKGRQGSGSGQHANKGLSGSNEPELRSYRKSRYQPDLDRLMSLGPRARTSGPLGGT